MALKSSKEDRIKVECTVKKILFFKNNWGIIACNIDKLIEGELKTDKDHTVMKGEMPTVIEGEQYKATCIFTTDARYGDQYNIEMFASNITLDTADQAGQRKFLESIFTKKQVEAMYEALENPYQAFIDQDTVSLCKIKGCGLKVCPSWLLKFKENYHRAIIYSELNDYNLSTYIIDKLLDRYSTPELVIEKVKNNPYTLVTEVKGIGWGIADKIAMASGMDEYDPNRISAFIIYYLREQGENGYSWITNDHLMGAILEQFGQDIPDPPITEAVQSLIKEDKLWFSDDKQRIGIKWFYTIERKIAENLIRLLKAPNRFKYDHWEEAVARIERLQGWEYTEEQKAGIKLALENNVVLIQGGAGCVDCDTEFFNGTEWKKISEYKLGEKVLQYNLNGTAELVTPIAYIKNECKYLWHFKTKYGLDQCLSDNHNCIMISPKGKIKEEKFYSVKARQNEGRCRDKFITAFNYEGQGIQLSDDLIRIYIACFADGNFSKKATPSTPTYLRARFNLTKPRKIARLAELARKAGLKFHIEKYNKTVQQDSYDCFVYMPERIKEFPEEWYNCNKHQLEVIADEIMLWDGVASENNRYTTVIKKNADFVQFVFTSLGKRATILTSNRIGTVSNTKNKKYYRKSIEYTVCVAKNMLVGFSSSKTTRAYRNTKINQYETKDGYEYCFNVPSHALVLRRNNKIFITGNCGKTSLVSAVIEILKNYDFVQCALSGKAASRLMEITGQEGYTIHRLLEYPKGDDNHGKFFFHEDNKMHHDIYIIDEVSMIDLNLFLHLIQAIEDGAKVIFLGDNGQLEAIGSGNIAFDLLYSDEIPSITLTKIHRQAERSAIITESVMIRNKQQIVKKDWVGHEVRGELQDLDLTCYGDSSNTYYKVMEQVQRYWALNKEVKNLQVLVPMKTKGSACTYILNNAIQELVNPSKKSVEETRLFISKDMPYVLRVGDKVINTVNNYKVEPNIFNGNIGIIKSIWTNNETYEDFMTISFEGIGDVDLAYEFWRNIELAYAITVHKYQGSQSDTIIFGLDFNSYTLLSKELLYTGITRAKKKCYLIAQTSALRFGTGKSSVIDKQTHLKEQLYEVAHPKLIF